MCACAIIILSVDKLYIILNVSVGLMGSDPAEFSRDPNNNIIIPDGNYYGAFSDLECDSRHSVAGFGVCTFVNSSSMSSYIIELSEATVVWLP